MKMNTDVFQQMLDAQKNFIETWQKAFQQNAENISNIDPFNVEFNPMAYFQQAMDLQKKMMTSYQGTPEEVYNRMKENSNAYKEMYKLWSELNGKNIAPTAEEMKELYEKWSGQYQDYMKEHFWPYLPEPMKKVMQDSVNTMESYRTASDKLWSPWLTPDAGMNDAMFKGLSYDPAAYIDSLQIWKENYEKTFSKMLNAPMMGFDREKLEKQTDSYDKFIRFSVLLQEFMANITKTGQDTMKKVLDDYAALGNDPKQPQSFEEFYKYWTLEINKALDNLFFSDDFSKLVGQTLTAMTEFKIEADHLWEEYLKQFPIPKNSEMKSLYESIYKLKKELKESKKEIAWLKEKYLQLVNEFEKNSAESDKG